MTLTPIIALNEGVKLEQRGRALVVPFTPHNNTCKTRREAFVGLSVCKVELGMLWVEDWILQPNRSGIGGLKWAGFMPTCGRFINTIEVQPSQDLIKKEERQIERSQPNTTSIKRGYFTVVKDGTYHTFRFRTYRGKTFIGILDGHSYANFGQIADNRISYWRTAYKNSIAVDLGLNKEVIAECFAAIVGNKEEAGKRYAMASKRCYICGKLLTTPESLIDGRGPVCSSRK